MWTPRFRELSKNMPLFPSILDDELGEEVRNVTSEVNCAFGNNCQELEDSASASRLKFRPLSMELSHCENYAAGSTYEHVRLSKTASKAENDSFNLEASTLCSSSFELVNTKKSGKRHRCETCGKYFSFSSGLSRHKHTHSVNKPERSKQKVHLAVPSSTAPTSHSAVKAYRCQPCGKVFASCSYLKTHMRTHTGMKPFRCEHCGARSADRSSLRKHKLIHTGDRPYFCHRCKKRFAELKLLTQHLATHTEREPYTCKECGTRFAQYLLYKRHVRGHIGEKPFGCNLCGKCCAKASALKKHMLTHTKRRWFCRR